MMEDHFIENNNGVNGMSAADGGSSDLAVTEDQGSVGSDAFTTPLAQYKPHDDHLGLLRRRRTNVSQMISPPTVIGAAGTEENKYPFDYSEDDHHNLHLQLTPLTKTPSPKFYDISKFLNYISGGLHLVDAIYNILKKPVVPQLLYEPHYDRFGLQLGRIKLRVCGDDYCRYFLWNRLIELGEGEDEVSQMIYPPTVIDASGTEQRSPLLDTRVDIPGGNSNDERKGWSKKMDFEWIFVITNIVLESMSTIFTQISSKQKPQYALFGMLLSYLALLTCIIEIIYEGHRHRHQQIPIWRRRRGGTFSYRQRRRQIPIWRRKGTWSYYRPQRRKSFATLNNIVALACAVGQCVVTTINYRFDSLIKLTVSPIILANGVLFSKILKYRQRDRQRDRKAL